MAASHPSIHALRFWLTTLLSKDSDFAGFCKALFSLDKSLCKGTGQYAAQIEKNCKEAVDERKKLGKDLESMAASDASPANHFAAAALGKYGACTLIGTQLRDLCSKVSPVPPTPKK